MFNHKPLTLPSKMIEYLLYNLIDCWVGMFEVLR